MCSFQHLDNIEDLFHAADGFILTSRYEGLSLSVLQALACGLKVFLTAVPGNTSLRDLGFDEIGWVTPDRSESVLASRIETSLLPWLKEPSPPHAGQVERARALFNDQIQCGKILRAYRRAASHAER
jgi:glycosyltransferase involved in cell wall biosynthesis